MLCGRHCPTVARPVCICCLCLIVPTDSSIAIAQPWPVRLSVFRCLRLHSGGRTESLCATVCALRCSYGVDGALAVLALLGIMCAVTRHWPGAARCMLHVARCTVFVACCTLTPYGTRGRCPSLHSGHSATWAFASVPPRTTARAEWAEWHTPGTPRGRVHTIATWHCRPTHR